MLKELVGITMKYCYRAQWANSSAKLSLSAQPRRKCLLLHLHFVFFSVASPRFVRHAAANPCTLRFYCFRFTLFLHLFLCLSYVPSRVLFPSHFRSFHVLFFLSSRFGSPTDAQNGDARRSFARNDARWIMWAAAETGAQTTIPEMEMPEAMAAPTSATQTPSALQCPPHQDYLWIQGSTRCTRPFRSQLRRWPRTTGECMR